MPYCAQQMKRKYFLDNKFKEDPAFADFLQVLLFECCSDNSRFEKIFRLDEFVQFFLLQCDGKTFHRCL